MSWEAGKYDIIVIGAGHAGCEAGLAGARMGKNTLVLTISLDAVALMACNPSIGGTAKGHLVREVDALGGEMGKNIDKTMLQSKMLNTSKGAAVRSLRAQADKKIYQQTMKQTLENTPLLSLKQGEVKEILTENGKITGVLTGNGEIYRAEAVIIAAGVYLESEIIIGENKTPSGPSGLFPSHGLSKALADLGLRLRRFKTGTPARVDGRTIDYSVLEPQYGDERIVPFSFSTDKIEIDQVPCWLTYTNRRTHEIIRANLHRAPLYSGLINGVGPRYCPSIEDKIVRFADKERHQVFIEPEGSDTGEMYLQGLSTSLPYEVQVEFLRTIKGLENVEVMRPAYAIEYDCLDSLDISPDLSVKGIRGLFSAGQINGSSGYEEAAAQGLIAGINAVCYLRGEKPLILGRDQAYIGVLIDDLVTKGPTEPYRMMTARAEYRLILRQDNADIRLSEIGYNLGLISAERYEKMCARKQKVADILEILTKTHISPQVLNPILERKGCPATNSSVSLKDLLKRPEIKCADVLALAEISQLDEPTETLLETTVKYEGYIQRQNEEIQHVAKLEKKILPQNFDYNTIKALRIEARQKLNAVQPINIGQASRISGVSPADISVLLIYMEKEARANEGTDN
jgi:tRNA uridine 5-carboxymethylaminomethyl modification enzyme